MAGNPLSAPVKILLGLLVVIVAIAIFVGAVKLAQIAPKVGETVTNTPILMPGWLATAVNAIIGPFATGSITLEGLVLRLAIFAIIFFGVSEIIMLFSTFTTATSYLIGFGLALIAGVTKGINAIAGIFTVAAGLGALGIALIILGALASAVTLNLGIGGWIRRWRMERQMEIEAMKSDEGTGRVTSAIKGLKQVERSFSGGELKP